MGDAATLRRSMRPCLRLARGRSRIWALLLTLAGLATFGLANVCSAQGSSSVAHYSAEADARVEEAAPTVNFGSSSYLRADGGVDPDVDSYVRFNVSGLSGFVTRATLRLYATSFSVQKPSVYAAGNGWSEDAITWQNRPGRLGDAITAFGPMAPGDWVEYDVTSVLSGNGTYSFQLATTSFDGANFSSREGEFAPQLVVETAADNTPPTQPAVVSVTDSTENSISVEWTPSTDDVGVAGYDLFRNDTRVGTTTETSYTFTGLDCGTTYTLGVDAFDAAGNVSGRASITGASSPCGGGVFYVSPTGSDSNPGTLTQPWRTIGKAMDSLQAGQRAYLRAGTYEEERSGPCDAEYNKLTWTRSGTSSAPITISGYAGEERQVIVNTAIRLAGSYQRLANIVADRNYTYNQFDSDCLGGPNVQLYGPHDTVSGVEVRNSRTSGIYAEGAAYATVTGNWIHDNGTHYNLDHGFYWLRGPNSLIADNIVAHNYANGIKIGPDAQSVVVSQNTVNGNGRSGIDVCGSSSYRSNNNTIADNIVTWNGWSSGGGFGLRTYWESAGVGTGNQAVRNLMWGNSNGDSWYPGGGMTETASISADPLFASLAGGNFHLLQLSPAVDTANANYSNPRDYAGAARPQGGGPDIGAYER